MAEHRIAILNRIAVADAGIELVCNNPTDTIRFEFDEEWSGIAAKTARFSWDGNKIDVPFSGNVVVVPEIFRTNYVFVGVYTDNITSTPAKVKCRYSIKCLGGKNPPPSEDVYKQILALINDLQLDGVSDEQIAEAVQKYFEDNPIEGGSGGYYTPEVDADGNLSWAASKEDMPSPATVNIKGEPGKDGVDGKDGNPGKDGSDGQPGKDGKGIESIAMNADFTLTLTLDDGTSYTTPSIRGTDGAPGADGEDGQNGADGEDGVSPTVTVSTITGGHRVTITDKNGTKTVDVLDGSKGEQGPDGEKGDKGDKGDSGADGGYYEPSVDAAGNLTWIPSKDDMFHVAGLNIKGPKGDPGASVTVLSITESDEDGGTNTVAFTDGKILTVKNGTKGDPGSNGADGKTPVKGTDYFTAADKAEMAEQVKDAISADSSWLNGYNIPILYLTGDTTGMSKDVEKTLTYSCKDYEGTEYTGSCTLKWQGSSSLAYDKKNYTIKLDTAIEAVEGWSAQKKYCLKANFIDHTHARNVVSAKLWGQIVASRSPVNTTLKACPNYGAVDGFPIAIVLNGEFHGLYTWNIPKDMWTFNMGDGTQEAVICANYNTPAVNLRVHSKVDGSDHELEEVTDEDNAAWVATSLNNVIDLCVNSYGADLDTTIAQYLDWESAIDYFIFTVIMDGRDMVHKNYIMVTWNGTKWVFSAYDMDSTYGLDWNGSALLPPHEGVTFEKFRVNRVMELVYRFKTDALKARYKALREGVLSEYSIANAFENFTCAIPSRLLREDVKKWPSVPSTAANTLDQILRWLHHRLGIVDKWIEAIPVQETPIAPVARDGNIVPMSLDASGSIYNGTGYRDGYIANIGSDGVESEIAVVGASVTGYIPMTKDNVIKVTTDAWNASPVYSRITFYNADLVPIGFYTQNGYIGAFNGYKEGTDSTSKGLASKDKQSVTYGSDGMTTLNIAYSPNCTDVMYCRINATCPGKNLVVIREGDVPEHAPDLEPGGIINQVPLSTDIDGSVYNGTGYQDGYCLAYDTAGATLTELANHTVTGFIPVAYTDVIRMTGATWGSTNKNGIMFFDENKKPLGGYIGNGYVVGAQAEHSSDGIAVQCLTHKTECSVTVVDGVATFNMTFMSKDTTNTSGGTSSRAGTHVKYVRIGAEGSGANMIVTVNQEIT